MSTDKPNDRSKVNGLLELGTMVVATFEKMLKKSDNHAVELTRPAQEIILKPSLYNWKLDTLHYIPSLDALKSMSVERLRGIRLTSMSSAKGFDELTFLSFTFTERGGQKYFTKGGQSKR